MRGDCQWDLENGSRDQLAFNGSQALCDWVASWDARCEVDKIPGPDVPLCLEGDDGASTRFG